VRRFANNKQATLGIGAAAVVLLIAVVLSLVGKDDKPRAAEQARLVLREAADRQRHGCDHRPDFRVYTLSERFNGEYATEFSSRCETHADQVFVFYGPCRKSGESGCGYDAYVATQPACLRPRELDLTFNGPPSGDLTERRMVTTLRGVPAAISDHSIVLMTRDTLITISADAKPAREAVDALRAAADVALSGTTLPKPDASVVGGKLRNRQCPV
jgi:hypothetical protein